MLWHLRLRTKQSPGNRDENDNNDSEQDYIHADIVTQGRIGVYRFGNLTKENDVIFHIGGEACSETTLTEFHFLLSAQGDGKSGPLLVDGGCNLFFIKDVKDELSIVRAYWSGAGAWYLHVDRFFFTLERKSVHGFSSVHPNPRLAASHRGFFSHDKQKIPDFHREFFCCSTRDYQLRRPPPLPPPP